MLKWTKKSVNANTGKHQGDIFIMNKKVLTALAVAGIATAAMATDVSADTYTVQTGDTLSSIATNHNTTIDRIISVNKITNANLIFAGQQVELDDQAVAPVAQQTPVQAAPVQQAAPVAPVQQAAPVQAAPVQQKPVQAQPVSTAAASGSTYDQFIAAGGNAAMWQSIVMPESGGNVNASNGQYHGLGQTNQSWGHGSVASQTAGMLNYANSRYGSVDNAISFRAANGWW